ncbi:MAG: cyclin-dependent kinase inhibitor 3 family protein [Rhodospirillaceae bacterium]|nr:cyclin-dependent kinase inhibitor 3 family protein [Rhodospirillaceae bacterium]
MRPVKTSNTHPLPLASVSVPNVIGRILFTMCPGKKQPNAATGPWDRDLDIDLDAARDAEVTTMVTLMEGHEIMACALSGEILEQACRERGMAWRHCPIADLQIPSEGWEQAWLDTGQVLREAIRKGETILLHCRGGRGRAGMVAARLLVELGAPGNDAIAQVRAQRLEAIETSAQEEHIRTIYAITERE